MRRSSLQSSARRNQITGFTLVELLVVILIITILAGLVLGTAGYVQRKAASSRAVAEIAGLSAALESYKADNGSYPRDTPKTGKTDVLKAGTNGDPSQAVYTAASNFLYNALSPAAGKNYFEFKPNMLSANPPVAASTYIVDPFGKSYGYSTAYNDYQDELNGTAPQYASPNPAATVRGNNPTFDLWSTAGYAGAPSTDSVKWLKNW